MKKKIPKRKKEMTITKTKHGIIARHDREIEFLRDRILQIETKLAKVKF